MIALNARPLTWIINTAAQRHTRQRRGRRHGILPHLEHRNAAGHVRCTRELDGTGACRAFILLASAPLTESDRVSGFIRAAMHRGGQVASPGIVDHLYTYAWFVTFFPSFVCTWHS